MTAWAEPKNDWASPDAGDYAEMNKIGDGLKHLHENRYFSWTAGATVVNYDETTSYFSAHYFTLPDGYKVLLRRAGVFTWASDDYDVRFGILDFAGVSDYYAVTPAEVTGGGGGYFGAEVTPEYDYGIAASGADLQCVLRVNFFRRSGVAITIQGNSTWWAVLGIEPV